MIQKLSSAFFPILRVKKKEYDLCFHISIKCLVLVNSLQNPDNVTQLIR